MKNKKVIKITSDRRSGVIVLRKNHRVKIDFDVSKFHERRKKDDRHKT